MKRINGKTKKIVYSLFVLGLIFLAVGVTYAFFNADFKGNYDNELAIGQNLMFRYDESEVGLNLITDKILTDEEGKTQDKYFDFEVGFETDTETSVNYYIYLTKDGTSTLEENNIKIYLTDQNDNSLVDPTKISELATHKTYDNSRYLYGKKITSNNNEQFDKYRIRVWATKVNQTITNTGDSHIVEVVEQKYKFKVNVATGEMPKLTKTAYAVYSETDNSLTFYNTADVVMKNEIYRDKFVTEVWTGFENGSHPWADYASSIKSVTVADEGIAPIRTTEWFVNFVACTKMDLAKLDTSNITSMNAMFYKCNVLTELNLSNFNTQNVTDMSYMFGYCSALTSVGDISGWNTQNVTNMSVMFDNCSSLTSLDLSGWNTQNVTNMGGMFSFCSKLTSIDLSGWNTQNVSQMDNMFMFCRVLNSISFGDSWDTSNVTSMSYMFDTCKALNLDCSGWNVGKVTSHFDFNYSASGVIAPTWKN